MNLGWRRRSSLPPLPDNWLVLLYNYSFYRKGQVVDLPTMHPISVSVESLEANEGTVIRDALFDEAGRTIISDVEADWIEKLIIGEHPGKLQ